MRLAIFDLLEGSIWMDLRTALAAAPSLRWVPIVAAEMPFDLDAVLALAEGSTLIRGANHVREGIVVKPMHERTDPEVGRVCLKVVSNAYLEKA